MIAKKRGRLKIFIVAIAAMLVGGYIAAAILLFFFQRSLLYARSAAAPPANVTVNSFRSENETIAVITREVEGSKALVYFGGKGEDVAVPFAKLAEELPDRSLYFMYYRGFGPSTGLPTEAGIKADGLTVFDAARTKYAKVAVMGRSLGSGIATYVAASRDVDQLVLTTPYDSIENVAKGRFPIFPVSMILEDKFDSAAIAPNIKADTLVILADRDWSIPRARSEKLIEKFNAKLAVVTLPGTDHNSVAQDENYVVTVRDFLRN
ncbi:MAG TPA: hypothetical protein PKA82_16460 [Pyrinomonadaceae bacterium]|nr:hypothetical protein [Pyrinomonadaceae bacterium]